MPVITMDGPKLNREQKSELVKEFTKTASQVTNLPESAFVVIIRESDPDNVGVGGQLLSDKIK